MKGVSLVMAVAVLGLAMAPAAAGVSAWVYVLCFGVHTDEGPDLCVHAGGARLDAIEFGVDAGVVAVCYKGGEIEDECDHCVVTCILQEMPKP